MGRFIILPSPQKNNHRIRDSLFYKAGALAAGGKIDGDYFELGVSSCGSFISAYRAIQHAFEATSTVNMWNTEADAAERRKLWNQMRFFAFDSFQGLPKINNIDSYTAEFGEGKFYCSQENFKHNLSQAGVPLEKVTTIPGWYKDALNDITRTSLNMRSAAIVHMDCDLYESAKLVLAFIAPLLVDGTVIIFDDWYQFRDNPNMGEQKAFYEWIVRNHEWIFTEYQRSGPWSNSFIANKKSLLAEKLS